MYSLFYLEPVCCSMSSSNCCFLTCMQVSQEAGQAVWYSHLFQNFPVYCDPHSRRLSCSLESKNRCFFWNSLAFSRIQWMWAIWSLVPLPFFFYFEFFFFYLWWILSYIEMKQKWVYMCSPSWSSLPPSAFSKTSLNIWKFTVHILLKSGLENFEH